MPNMADITVKKNDGTTNIVYAQQIASAGDKSPAIWRCITIGTAASHRPELRLISQSNGPGTARKLHGKYTYPSVTTDVNGVPRVTDRLIIEVNILIPQGMLDVDVNEGATQGLNLLASDLIKSSAKVGFAPT